MAGGGGNGPNKAAGKASVTPSFSAGTAVKVKAAAVINSNATVLRASTLPYHVVSSTSLGTGVYELRFSHSIGGCAWVGTVGLGGFSGSTGPAQITITCRAGTNNGLFITTFNGAGGADERAIPRDRGLLTIPASGPVERPPAPMASQTGA